MMFVFGQMVQKTVESFLVRMTMELPPCYDYSVKDKLAPLIPHILLHRQFIVLEN